MDRHRIPPKHGAAFAVDAGATFAVVTPEPRQVADLVAYDRGEPAVRFEQSYTRDLNATVRPTVGDVLIATDGDPLATITGDDCGVHDVMFGPCTEWMLADRPTGDGRQDEPGGCRENLSLALSAYGLDVRVPDTLNLFQASTVAEDGTFDVAESPAAAGDAVTFRADRDAVVAVSACSAKGVASGTTLSPVDLRVPPGAAVAIASVHDDRPDDGGGHPR